MRRPDDAPVPELIPVRADERFDEVALQAYLSEHLEGAEGDLHVEQFAGGHANLTYLLRYGNHEEPLEYVLRRPPLGPVAPSAHDMGREYRVLSRLWKVFPPAPRAYVYCDDPAVIGAPFFVMERRRGVVVRNVVPAEFGGGADHDANRRLSEVVIDTLAEFHAADPAAAGLGDLGKPEGFLERQVIGWIQRWERARLEPNPLADELAAWLVARLPASPSPTLLHNDWRLDNMAVDPADPGRCTAVYDWDMATRGDPLADLGTVMAVWYQEDEVPTSLNPMPTDAPGFMNRNAAIARYAERSGRDTSGMSYYSVFGTFKMAVILQQIYVRWYRGQTQDERFADMGPGAQHLLDLAAARRTA